MKVLLYHTGALGDFVTTLPVIAAWKQVYPDARVVLFGKPQCGELGAAFNLIDATIDITAPAYSSLFSDQLRGPLVDLLRTFTHAFILSEDDSPVINHCRKAALVIFHQRPFPERHMHIIDYHRSIIQKDELSFPIPKVSVATSLLEQTADITPTDKKAIAIHPGSGSTRKNWPYNRFVKLSRILREKGFFVQWITGPAEQETALALADADLILSSPSPGVLAAILSRCSLYIGNDSGVTHLAAFTGCPVVALFGASDPTIWGPRGDVVKIIRKNAACAPCHPGKPALPCDNFCMNAITVDEVLHDSLLLCGINSF